MREPIEAFDQWELQRMDSIDKWCPESEVRALESYCTKLESKNEIMREALEECRDINERYLTDDDDDPSNMIDMIISETLAKPEEE